MERTYIAIDLKSFYASVECIERKRDALTTNLVVADASRTEKTICLAVSPSLKSFHIPGRARLFEVVQKVKEINSDRRILAPNRTFTGKSDDINELNANKSLELDYIVATPRMALYEAYSSRIYSIYLKYVAPEDIHVYSIDEVFIDATVYLKRYNLTAREFTMKLILDVLNSTGITATAGIAPNLYLCKVAMDIEAKHIPADKNGVRIAELTERTYREKMWAHRPITDFWRVGRGISKRLEEYGIMTMGDIARCSVKDEELLYKEFGINAELLIDHAWGYEPCTIEQIKSYKPLANSLSTGQVLKEPYCNEKAKLIVSEMTELLVLDLVEKGLETNQIVLTVIYDTENLTNPEISRKYKGAITTDYYGREVPKQAHGSKNIGRFTNSNKLIMKTALELFNEIINKDLLVRKVYVVANNVIKEGSNKIKGEKVEQLNFFTDYEEEERKRHEEEEMLSKEKRLQKARIEIMKKYGKNAILKGMNLEEGGTTIERNGQIGGHKA